MYVCAVVECLTYLVNIIFSCYLTSLRCQRGILFLQTPLTASLMSLISLT